MSEYDPLPAWLNAVLFAKKARTRESTSDGIECAWL
jgi:hypothetical protein